MTLRRPLAWSLASLAFVAATLLSVSNAAYFSWLTARPPLAAAQGPRELTEQELGLARGRARLWSSLAAAGIAGAAASALMAWRVRGGRSVP